MRKALTFGRQEFFGNTGVEGGYAETGKAAIHALRGGILAVFLFMFCLLGVDDARA